MKKAQVSMCYYPTTAIFVDDQVSFLNDLDLGLDKSIVRKLYNDPNELVNDFNRYSGGSFISRCLIQDEEENQDEDLISHHADIRLLHMAIYNPKRFDDISVLVADYAMPGTNGLECCRAVQDKNIKRMLLTGEADSALAVAAFNEGIIDKFIQKGNLDQLISQVNESVLNLQKQYFIDLSDKLKGLTAPAQITQCLNDSAFSELFYKYCKNHNIFEYYLLDNQGSFLMLDERAVPHWLIVKNEQEMENLYQFAKIEPAPSAVVDALKNREKVPFFYTEEDFKTPPSQWEKFMHPAKKLDGKDIYYYAFLSEPKLYLLKKKKIVSYQKYLSSKA